VRGRSFLRYMVRKIVGTLVDVGRGKTRPDEIPGLIAACDRSKAGPTMAPQGLCLHGVEYAEAAATDAVATTQIVTDGHLPS